MALLGSWHRPLVASILAVALGCAKATTEEVSPTKAPSRIEIDLPPGFSVAVDGASVGETPLASIEIKPGEHEVEVRTPCGSAKTNVVLADEANVNVNADAFPELGWAQLTVTARALDGTALQPTIALGEWTAPGSSGTKLTVPACKLRLHVSSEGVGGFIEDLELKPGQEVARDVVLAPGPDMVRMYGGPFKVGPPEEKVLSLREMTDTPSLIPDPVPVDVPTFDLDRTEVTAAQFMACVEAGGCKVDSSLMLVTAGPYEHPGWSCTIDRKKMPIGPSRLVAVDGREAHSATCVAEWQARAYCEWAGKRLPTDVEWEYAARSGKPSYECPHGSVHPDESACAFGSARGPSMPCARPERNNDQGVCDLMESVREWVAHTPTLSQIKYDGQVYCYAGAHPRVWEGSTCYSEHHRSPSVGFRCARDALSSRAEPRVHSRKE